MKTKQEIKEEIIELYAAQKAYSEIVERLFSDVEELKDMLKVIKNRQVRNSVTTCFDEAEAA